LISSNDFLPVYLSIELQSLCFYVLVASNFSSKQSIEASTKYFILGALGSGFFLFGISFIYGYYGTTNFELISQLNLLDNLKLGFYLGIFLVFIGVLFKIGIVPFHF
jgi:NADH-quinone oxidoreductase subunit N